MNRLDNSGVTLIELIVVLAVIGILIAVAPPSLQGRSRSRLQPEQAIRATRLRALEQARAISFRDTSGRVLLLLPDGSILGRGRSLVAGEANAPTR